MWENKTRQRCGFGECHGCNKKRELYTYDFMNGILFCEECIEEVIPEEWMIGKEEEIDS